MVNIDNQPAASFDSVYKAAALDGISFAPETPTLPASGWPTLGNMIDSGKRLVSYLDNGADPSIPYLIDGAFVWPARISIPGLKIVLNIEFTNIWETAFNLVNPDLFDCTVNRTKGDTSTQMFLINHFLNKLVAGSIPAPDPDNANVTNAATGAGSLGAHVDTCRTVQGRPPTFLLVDVRCAFISLAIGVLKHLFPAVLRIRRRFRVSSSGRHQWRHIRPHNPHCPTSNR